MNARSCLHRALPLLTLSALLLALSLPASAFLFGGGEEEEASVTAFAKNGPATGVITFSADDFQVTGSESLDAIVLDSLPDEHAGVLTLAGEALRVGDVVAMTAVDGMRFQPLAAPTVASTSFTFTARPMAC